MSDELPEWTQFEPYKGSLEGASASMAFAWADMMDAIGLPDYAARVRDRWRYPRGVGTEEEYDELLRLLR